MTCTAWNMKFGQKLRVTNLKNGAVVIVTVTDRGPALWTGNAVDLTPAAFSQLSPLSKQGPNQSED